jgi:hypothetical protein
VSDFDEPRIGLPEDAAWSRDVHEEALARKGATDVCEACGSSAWGVGERLLLVQALDPGGRFIPGRGVEVVPVFCRHCGLLHLHVVSVLLRD